MKAVLRHELRSYFTNPIAYVFGAFLLLFVGIYTMVYNLNYYLTNFEYVMGAMSFVFLIIVPILTMRVLAEERRQKTDQLLYSLPLTMTKVVVGKYVSMLCVFLVPVAVACLYPLALSAYGNVYLPASYTAVTGFFFLGAALIAIGTFISSLTESQGVAAGLCFAVMLLNYFLASLANFVPTSAFASFVAFTLVVLLFAALVRMMTKNTLAAFLAGIIPEGVLIALYIKDSTMFEGLFADVMKELSLYERFYVFVNGVFDLTGIVYFCSVIGVFLFLSVQSMERRRWSE